MNVELGCESKGNHDSGRWAPRKTRDGKLEIWGGCGGRGDIGGRDMQLYVKEGDREGNVWGCDCLHIHKLTLQCLLFAVKVLATNIWCYLRIFRWNCIFVCVCFDVCDCVFVFCPLIFEMLVLCRREPACTNQFGLTSISHSIVIFKTIANNVEMFCLNE